MKPEKYIKHLSGLLLATLFISTSGVLGKYIAMPSEVIVWFRSALAAVFIFGYAKHQKVHLKVAKKEDHLPLIMSSLFMAAHWITYFYALKLSNVALGMLSLFTFPVMTALLEPLFFKTRLNPVHIVMGFMVLLGIYFLTPNFDVKSSYVQGILFGLCSALCYALRILIIKPYTKRYHSSMLMYYQTLVISIVLLPVLFLKDVSGLETQFPYLIMLALLTTAIGHTLMVNSLRFFSVSTATIISSIQPIFGIVLAYLFLAEIPSWSTFVGGMLIIITVAVESIRSQKK